MAKAKPKITKPSITYGPKRPAVPIKQQPIEKIKVPRR